MVYLLYDLILYVSALFLVPYYLYRGVRYGKTRRGIRERLGAYAQDLLLLLEGRQVIWVHAVSVGETRAAIPLLKAVRERYPEALLLLSNVTETGRAIATDVSEIDAYIFFPFDLSWIVRKALKIIRPSIIILVETEIWPNFVLEARRQNIPLVLVNGRISDRSFPRYRMAGRLLEPVLDSISDYCMQSEQDSRRIRHLGAAEGRVRVTGNLKFDMQPPSIDDTNLESLKSELKLSTNACVWVAGSTHDGEETQLVDVYQKLRKVCPDLLLVLVPRHPERCRQVYDELTKAGFIVTLRSTLATMNRTLQPGEVMVVDTLGEMLKLYALSNLVFVGGSLVPTGGHNLLEPSAAGLPVLFGPHIFNFADIADQLISAQAAIQTPTKEHLQIALESLLENPERCAQMGANGQTVVEENRGSTLRAAQMIISRLS